MGYLRDIKKWLNQLLSPFIATEEDLQKVVDEIGDKILQSYKNGLREGKASVDSPAKGGKVEDDGKGEDQQ